MCCSTKPNQDQTVIKIKDKRADSPVLLFNNVSNTKLLKIQYAYFIYFYLIDYMYIIKTTFYINRRNPAQKGV